MWGFTSPTCRISLRKVPRKCLFSHKSLPLDFSPINPLSMHILTSAPQTPHPTSHPFAYAKSFSSWACRGKMALGSKDKSSLGPQEPYWWKNFKYLIIFVLSPLPHVTYTNPSGQPAHYLPWSSLAKPTSLMVAASLCATHICGMSSSPHKDWPKLTQLLSSDAKLLVIPTQGLAMGVQLIW